MRREGRVTVSFVACVEFCAKPSLENVFLHINAFSAFRPFLFCSFRGIEEWFSPRVFSFISMAAATRGRYFEVSFKLEKIRLNFSSWDWKSWRMRVRDSVPLRTFLFWPNVFKMNSINKPLFTGGWFRLRRRLLKSEWSSSLHKSLSLRNWQCGMEFFTRDSQGRWIR